MRLHEDDAADDEAGGSLIDLKASIDLVDEARDVLVHAAPCGKRWLSPQCYQWWHGDGKRLKVRRCDLEHRGGIFARCAAVNCQLSQLYDEPIVGRKGVGRLVHKALDAC